MSVFDNVEVIKICPKDQYSYLNDPEFLPIHQYPVYSTYLDREIGAIADINRKFEIVKIHKRIVLK